LGGEGVGVVLFCFDCSSDSSVIWLGGFVPKSSQNMLKPLLVQQEGFCSSVMFEWSHVFPLKNSKALPNLDNSLLNTPITPILLS